MSQTYTLACDQGATLTFVATWLDAIPTASWAPATVVGTNDSVVPSASNGYIFECTTAGLTGALEPTWPTTLAATVTDGTVVWTCAGPDVAAQDLSSYTAYMGISSTVQPVLNAANPEYLAFVTTTPSSQGSITLGGAAGTVTVVVTGETTALLTAKKYYYDLFLISPTDVSTMLLTGTIVVTPAVTTPTYE